MKKVISMYLVFVVLILSVSFQPMNALASSSSDYIEIKKNDSYTINNYYYLSFNFNNVSKNDIEVTAKLLNPSGGVIWNYKGYNFVAGETKTRSFGFDYSTLSSGTYTLKVIASCLGDNISGELKSWSWTYNIKYTTPKPSFTYKSCETYYDSTGRYMQKINIQCNNMKGERLYCKIYDSSGNLVTDWGTDTPVRKTNREIGYFVWDGYADGKKYPSGDYTFIVTSSANKKVLELKLKLNFLEVSNG